MLTGPPPKFHGTWDILPDVDVVRVELRPAMLRRVNGHHTQLFDQLAQGRRGL